MVEQNPNTSIKIRWTRCCSYAAAADFDHGVYIHEWHDRAYYIGSTAPSFGRRFNSGYRHWIDGCLERGAKLFFGRLHDPLLPNGCIEKLMCQIASVANESMLSQIEKDLGRKKVHPDIIDVEGVLIEKLKPCKNMENSGSYLGRLIVSLSGFSHSGDVPSYVKEFGPMLSVTCSLPSSSEL